MGLPTENAQKPTFYYPRDVDWAKEDREGNPWDWTDTPATDTQRSPEQIICAYEFFAPLGRQGAFFTEVGEFNPTTVVFTMFEDEFAAAWGFTYATIGPSGTKWWFKFWRPVSGLGALTVYEVACVAQGTE